MKLHLAKFIHSTEGKYLMSILLGFGLATFFRATCQGTDCVIRVAASSDSSSDSSSYGAE